MKPHEALPQNQQDFINNATFQYYYEYIKNHIFDLYEFNDNRLKDFNTNQIETICLDLSKKLIDTGHIWDYFEIKDSDCENAKFANIKKDVFYCEFENILSNFKLS